MFNLFVRRVRIAVAAALVTSLWMVPSASALVPPGEGGYNYSCNTMAAGYTPGAAGNASAWAWDGRLGWDWCVVRTTTGAHYGIVRLTSPGPTIVSGAYDKVWAVLTIRLQACNGTTLASRAWNPDFAVGSLSGSRYYWPWQQTASTSSYATSYRVQISGSGYVYRHDLGGWYFSLGAGPYPPSPASYHTYTSNCVNP